jgi:YHS domain-containing protein
VFRTILELIITILVAMVARAVISSVAKGLGNAAAASRQAPREQQQQQAAPKPTGELHKDPVCGTYVAESTAFQRRVTGTTYYYCSDACRSKHAIAS